MLDASRKLGGALQGALGGFELTERHEQANAERSVPHHRSQTARRETFGDLALIDLECRAVLTAMKVSNTAEFGQRRSTSRRDSATTHLP